MCGTSSWPGAVNLQTRARYQSSLHLSVMAIKQISIFPTNVKLVLRGQIDLEVTCVPGLTARWSTWRGWLWSSRQSSRRGTRACTPAVRPSITTRPRSRFKWRSRASTSSLVSAMLCFCRQTDFLETWSDQHNLFDLCDVCGFCVMYLCVCVCVCVLQLWPPWPAFVRPWPSSSSSPSVSGCAGELIAPPQMSGRRSAGNVLLGKWGQRCQSHKGDKQDVCIVNPTNQNPNVVQLFINRKQTGAAAALIVDR